MPRPLPPVGPILPSRPDAVSSALVRALRRAWLDGTLDLTVDLDDGGMDRLIDALHGSDLPDRPAPPVVRR